MKFILNPSLEHIALYKIVVTLWNQTDIRTLMRQFFRSWYTEVRNITWKEIEGSVAAKVAQFPLPSILKEKILAIIKPIGLQLLKWMRFHYTSYLSVDMPNEPCWNSQGMLDTKKMAEALIKDEDLDIILRFKLACIYCFESESRALWDEMPAFHRGLFPFVKSGHKTSFTDNFLIDLVKSWSRATILDRDSVSNSFYKSGFDNNFEIGNAVATEYFHKKLSPRQRELCLARNSSIFKANVIDIDVLYYVLTKLEDKEQEYFFKSKPYEVLKCLLKWPRQSFFLEMANNMWSFLSKETYAILLNHIIDKITRGFKDFNYRELLGKFWKEGPSSFKMFAVEKFGDWFLLFNLCKIKDKENLALILQDVSAEENKELVYCDRVLYFCKFLASSKRWGLLKYFIQQCSHSEAEMSIFKERLRECLKSHHIKIDWTKWNRLFRLPNASVNKSIKRNAEKGETSLCKRLHSEIEKS